MDDMKQENRNTKDKCKILEKRVGELEDRNKKYSDKLGEVEIRDSKD